MPKVSICLPNLNNCAYLEERLQSIYDQTVTDWELIIIDNYSDDGAWELFQEHAAKEPRIRLSQAPKAGMYANWNNTLKLVRGEWIYIATSDDTMYPECLEEFLNYHTRNSEARLMMCGIHTIDQKGNVLDNWHGSKKYPPRYTYGERLGAECVLPNSMEFYSQIFACGVYQSITGVLFHRDVLDSVGPFATDFSSAGDTAWIMNAVRSFPVHWIPKNLATWRLHGNQGSRQSKKIVGISDRDRAVASSLKGAEDANYISGPEIVSIGKMQSENRASRLNILMKIMCKIGMRNPKFLNRAGWVEELVKNHYKTTCDE